jgi:outer membrane protein OmpA-like peptidoglycan-associated protein
VLPITFARGSGQPSVEDAGGLARLVAALKAEPNLRVEIGGHTSDEGSDEFNRRLGLARAQAVARLLQSRGVAASRLLSKSYAESEPVASNATEEGRARNRRVTLRRLP